MKIAYFSPLNPLKSGISDYSEFLLPYLSRYSEIDLWVDGFKPDNPALKRYKVIDHARNRNARKKLSDYDAIIYNLGNNPHFHAAIYDVFLEYPGFVILHDFVLYYLVTGYYLDYRKDVKAYVEELYYNYGDEGIRAGREILGGDSPPLQHKHPETLPLVRRVLDKAKGIIVHSEYAREKLLEVGSPNSRVAHINQVNYNNGGKTSLEEVRAIRAKYRVGDANPFVASFGYIAPTKRNYQVIQATGEVAIDSGLELSYLMVGEGDYVDACLNERIRKTGYIPLPEFERLLDTADIVVNLRYPSMGETSATVLRAMAASKACIVSDDAWFSELPDDAVVKIPVDERAEKPALKNAIIRLATHPELRTELGRKARDYVLAKHDGDTIAREVSAFLSKDLLGSHTGKYLESLAERLLAIGLTEHNEAYLRVLAERLVRVL
ncbi:Glycosyl transferase, family 1 [Acididesulfobacillus acetoxydans]|uniref:Glycosyl transferase, family 1 n=1 Tax=Acididesulfobacillus acetoxydans TaxID=1561005 RepID=A0A8S0W1M8_9FIRM|nr:glycosyltransferase family 4 protein [Acididesulfobacillus acetoxydans]CAA7599568.1 Glycosyl transferase, family 1 [Acididesulfobacillus acetoxydans]CEJ07763.1 Glycosyltransferase [Acididesulfobacillus acetoxydans]